MYIDTNLSALLTEQAWNTNSTQLQTLDAQLATGQADPSPADNPADTTMATLLGGQLGMWTAQLQNTQQTVDALNTVMGTYQSLGTILDQLHTLAIQASSTTESPADRHSLSAQVTTLLQQMTALTTAATVNGQAVFAPSFTETRMGSTAPTITAITLDHYDQAAMADTLDQGTSFPLENVGLRMTIQGMNFPQPSTLAPFPNGTIDIRVPQYYFVDEVNPNNIDVHGGASYLTQAFQQQWSSTVIQTDGFGGGYGQTIHGSLTGPPPYIIMNAGQTVQLTIYNEALPNHQGPFASERCPHADRGISVKSPWFPTPRDHPRVSVPQGLGVRVHPLALMYATHLLRFRLLRVLNSLQAVSPSFFVQLPCMSLLYRKIWLIVACLSRDCLLFLGCSCKRVHPP